MHTNSSRLKMGAASSTDILELTGHLHGVTKQAGLAVTLQIHMQVVLGSNHGRTPAALTKIFRALPQSLQANSGIATSMRLYMLPFKSFPIRQSPLTLNSDVITDRLLTQSQNSAQKILASVTSQEPVTFKTPQIRFE